MELKHTIAALTLAILFILSCWTSPVAAEDPASPPPIKSSVDSEC